MKWYENSDRRAQPVIVHVLITGQLITGQLITGQLITGQLITEQLITGQLITGQFITRWFITDSQGEYCGDRQDKTDECEEGKDDVERGLRKFPDDPRPLARPFLPI